MRDETDERFERLLGATHDVAASADFTARVMSAVERETVAGSAGGGTARTETIARGIWGDLPRAAKIAVPVAAACAVASVVWAVFAFRAVDDATLATQDGAEQSVVATLYGPEVE